MEIMWFFLGNLTTAFIVAVYIWNKKRNASLSWIAWSGIIVSAAVFFFAIAWSISSLSEGEPQAAGMGMLIFGGISIILSALTRRIIIKETISPDE